MRAKWLWAVLLGAALAAPVWAKQPMAMNYDASQETTLRGSVVAIDEVACDACGGMMMGTHVKLQTAEGEKEIVLGPSAFLREKGFTLAKGDEIEVIGAPVESVFVVRVLTRSGKTLHLRGRNGRPHWAGRGRRGR